SCRAVAFSPDGMTFATVTSNGSLQLWDALSVKQIGTPLSRAPVQHSGTATCLRYSPDSRFVVSGDEDGNVQMLEAATGKTTRPLWGHKGEKDLWVRDIAISEDSSIIVTGSYDQTARIWKAATGEPIGRLDHEAEVEAVAISPDGKTVVTATSDGSILF